MPPRRKPAVTAAPDPPERPIDEGYLLGYLMLRNAVPDALEAIRSELFLNLGHRLTLGAIVRLTAAGAEPNPVSVSADLERHGDLEVAGGRAYLARLTNEVPGGPVGWRAIQPALQAVQEQATKRRLANLAADLSAAASNGHGVEELAQLAQGIVEVAAGSEQSRYLRRRFHTLDLTATVEPAAWVVTDLISQGGLTFLAGSQEAGKTYAALDLSISAITREPWLGQWDTNLGAGGIVYWDEENGPARLMQRGAKLARTRGIEFASLAPHLTILPKLGITDADPEGWAYVTHVCAERQPSLIILDTLRAIYAGDEDSSGEAQAFILKIGHLQVASGNPAVLVLCHPGKDRARGIRGSSRWPQAADVVVNMMTLPGNGHTKGLSWFKARDGHEPQPFAIRLTDIADDGIRLDLAALSSQERAREIHLLHPDWTQRDIANAIGCSISTVSRALEGIEE